MATNGSLISELILSALYDWEENLNPEVLDIIDDADNIVHLEFSTFDALRVYSNKSVNDRAVFLVIENNAWRVLSKEEFGVYADRKLTTGTLKEEEKE